MTPDATHSQITTPFTTASTPSHYRMSNDERCRADYQAITDPVYLITIPGAQLVESIAAIALGMFTFVRFFKIGVFHKNAKILICLQMVIYMMLCGFFICINGEHMYHYYFSYYDPCSFFKTASECSIRTYLYVAMLAGSAIIQVTIGVERLVSTLKSQYGKFTHRLGAFLAVLTIIIAVGADFYVLAETDATELRMGCYGLPMSSGSRASGLYISIIVCDLTSLILFVATWRINSKTTVQSLQYELDKNYQKVETRRLLKMLMPNVIFQTVFYATFALGTLTGRAMYAGEDPGVWENIILRHNWIPACAIMEFIVMNIILTRLNKSKKKFQTRISSQCLGPTTEAYFQGLAKQWN